MAGTNAGLLTLPAELLNDILSTVDKTDLKQFRCVSHACADLGGPYVFDEILFDLEPGGSDNLCAIASHSKLRHHVRTITLKRRNGFKIFGDPRDWAAATVYEAESRALYYDCSYNPADPQLMSGQEWSTLSERERQELFAQYCDDLGERDLYILRLAKAISPRPPTLGPAKYGPVSDAAQIMTDFTNSVRALSNLAACNYADASDDFERWCRTWRRIVFHPEALFDLSIETWADRRIDVSIDALQHFAALHSVMGSSRSIRSVQVVSTGLSFWTPRGLRDLLDWRDHPILGQQQLTASQAIFDQAEAITRHLGLWERSFGRLTALSCHLDCLYEQLEGPHYDELSANLASYLEEARNIERLSLVFVDEQCGGRNRLLTGNFIIKVTPSLQKLRRLHLRLVTCSSDLVLLLARLGGNLRHLYLDRVLLTSGGGTWELVLRQIAQRLRLNSIELLELADFPTPEASYLRFILDPSLRLWECANINRYSEYEGAIVQFALRKSAVMPPLDPVEFCKQHVQNGKKMAVRVNGSGNENIAG